MARRGKVALVTGGAGFIGSHLLQALARDGVYDTLVSVDITEPRFRVAGVRYRTADVREPLPDDLCPEAPQIFNLAALHVTPGHADSDYFRTNILGALHVCDYARRAQAETIVFTSSISVYGAGDDLKTEDTQPAPDSAYGQSKLCAEKIHRQWLDERPATRKLVIARPAAIYGRGEAGNFTRLASLLARGRFLYPGRRDTIKSCGYVADLVASFRFALARDEHFLLYNFCHHEWHSIEDICRAFHRVAGYRAGAPVVPLPLMLLAASFFEVLNALGCSNSVNRARVMKLCRSTKVEPRRLEQLGFACRYSLEESLAHWRSQSPSGRFE